MGVASTNHTDKFWHTGSVEEYSSEEFDGWGVRSYTRVWRSYLQAILNECYFWFHQCSDVIIYVILHYLFSDFIVVWMRFLTRIWVIWSTTVLLHFDSVDFPSQKSGRFNEHIIKDKVHFWPSNYSQSSILSLQLKNQISLTIAQWKPDKFSHLAGFKVALYFLRIYNTYYMFPISKLP